MVLAAELVEHLKKTGAVVGSLHVQIIHIFMLFYDLTTSQVYLSP